MAEISIESRKSKPNQSVQNKPNQIFQTQISLTQFTLQTNFAFYSIKIGLEIAKMSVGEKNHQTKAKPNHPNQIDSLNTLDHLIFVTKGCLQNFSFLGSVEVGHLWLETTTKQIGFRGYPSPQLKLS